MPLKKKIILFLFIFPFLGCAVQPATVNKEKATPVSHNNQIPIVTTNQQGPNSTGGFFRFVNLDGGPVANTACKVFLQENDKMQELGTITTDNNGEASLPETSITSDVIKKLKEKTLTLFLKAESNDKPAQINNIEF